MLLTPEIVKRTVKKFKCVDSQIDWDEPGKAIIWLKEGWTWDANDGNRSVEGFNLSDNHWEEPDSIDYLNERLGMIERIK